MNGSLGACDLLTTLDTKEGNKERQRYETGTHPQSSAVCSHSLPVVGVALMTGNRAKNDAAQCQAYGCSNLESGIDEASCCAFDRSVNQVLFSGGEWLSVRWKPLTAERKRQGI